MSLERWQLETELAEFPRRHEHVRSVRLAEGTDGSYVLSLTLSRECFLRLTERAESLQIAPEEILSLMVEDAIVADARKEYIDGITEEAQLRKLLAVRALGQASSLELVQIAHRLEDLAVRNASLAAHVTFERDASMEELDPWPWPALPHPPRGGGRPRIEADPTQAWVRTLSQILLLHYRDDLPWVQAYAQAGISEGQGVEYRRRAGLLDDNV